jgi:four helix bundle protein
MVMAESEITVSQQIRSFRDLEVWQAAMDLVVAVYDVATELPSSERFGLASQMRRAAISIPSNIAEGHAFRTSRKAYRRHVRIALGSLAEVETDTELTSRLRIAAPERLEAIVQSVNRTGQLLHGLLRSLRQDTRKRGEA